MTKMTRNDNPSKRSGRWRNITKECCKCEFKNIKDDKIICNFGGIIQYLFTKTSRIYNKCKLKSKNKNIYK